MQARRALPPHFPPAQLKPLTSPSYQTKQVTDAMHPSDSTTQQEAQWPPSDLRIGLNLTAKTLLNQISDQDTEMMDALPKEQWPQELWTKLGFNPPATRS